MLELTLQNLRSQVRTVHGVLVSTMEITTTETPGGYLFRAPDTTNWPIGDVFTDIEITIGDIVSSTDTMTIVVVKDVTR